MDTNIFIGLAIIISALVLSYTVKRSGGSRVQKLRNILEEYTKVLNDTMEKYKEFLKMLSSIDYTNEDSTDIVESLLEVKTGALLSGIAMTEIGIMFIVGGPQLDIATQMADVFAEVEDTADYSLKFMVSKDDFYFTKAMEHLDTSAKKFRNVSKLIDSNTMIQGFMRI